MKNLFKVLAVGLMSLSATVAFAQVQGDVNPNPTSSCVSITHNLSYRTRDISTNGDVSALQDFLQSQGYLNSEPTGYFGLMTQTAVQKFQSASGILNSGYVGPLTRAAIQTASCNGTTPSPVVTNPNQNQNSDQNDRNQNHNSTGMGCSGGNLFNPQTGQRCINNTQPVACTMDAKICPDGSYVSRSGPHCEFTACQTTSTTKLFVNLTTQQTNQTSNGFFLYGTVKGNPQNTKVAHYNLQIMCTSGVFAGDKFNNNLCGTTLSNLGPWGNPAQDNVILTTGVTNSANTTGSISLTLTAYDASNVLLGSDTETLSVASSQVQSQPSITVLSPNGGESYMNGNTVAISWRASNLTTNGQNRIDLIDSNGNVYYTIFATNILSGSSYQWGPLNNFPNGNYKIRITSTDPATNVTVSDTSDNYFTINSTPTNTSPTITVLSPNGGETLSVGSPYTIRWSSSGVTQSSVRIGITGPGNTGADIAVVPNTGSYAWNIPQSIGSMSFTGTNSAVYKIGVSTENTASNFAADVSDNAFSITTSTTPPPAEIVSLNVVSPSVSLGSSIMGPVAGSSSGVVGYYTTYSFTLINTGNTDVFLSKDPNTMLGLTSGGTTVASSTISSVATTPSAISGDTSTAYVIKAGTPRTVTFNGILKSPVGGGVSTLGITRISFTTSSGSSNTITSGLSALFVSSIF